MLPTAPCQGSATLIAEQIRNRVREEWALPFQQASLTTNSSPK